jgi:hypothetical protein
MSKARQFRVLAGVHDEGGKEYSKGSIVPSHRDLCAAFPNKFEEVILTPAAAQSAPSPASTPKEGDKGPENAANAAEKATPTGAKPAETGKTPPASVQSELGEDATGDFDEAIAAELKVFRKGTKKFFVAQPDELNKALNEEPLAKNEVGAFIKKLVG